MLRRAIASMLVPMKLPAALLASAALAACTSSRTGPAQAVPQTQDWRTIATHADRARLREWRDAWVEALAKARVAGHGAEIAAESVLLEPDSALPDVSPPAGEYRCRVTKIGAKNEGLLEYVAYPAFRCRIALQGGELSLVKLNGSQRPIGRLFADTERRLIFLGTMQLGDERRAYEYGADRERDLIGVFERIGERRWRLVFPRPHFESLLDVIELTPATP